MQLPHHPWRKRQRQRKKTGETTVALNEVNIREDESLSSSDVEWWTAEEYAKWLDEEKRSSAVYDW